MKQVARRPVSGWANAAAGLAISGFFGWLAIRNVAAAHSSSATSEPCSATTSFTIAEVSK